MQATMTAQRVQRPFGEMLTLFEEHFKTLQLPAQPETLYGSIEYICSIGGKRVRPVLCLMANELFTELKDDAFRAGSAIELFHTFSLVHDDIMDRAPIRRGMPTIHARYGEPTAILAGDLLLIHAYGNLGSISHCCKDQIIELFSSTASGICEGQQIDMDFEAMPIWKVRYEDYLEMVILKTSILLAASLQIGAILAGASEADQHHLYEFGKYVGVAFQIQDDYLDVFGSDEKFGKQCGGDIKSNKKTFLLLKAFELASARQRRQLETLMATDHQDKVMEMTRLYEECRVGEWARNQKRYFHQLAFSHLDKMLLPASAKRPLTELADWLLAREY
ncbi:polyprenyl synthetase family protein [Dyadobacter jiangsuensis]|uniref:Farnesyl-diphosphate synthase /geranylgeranyl-diphosphate synthase n=1 Tax=Dyadobacter jiangsuensis TaxID=1591085 RepID=A0A2P8FI85_9BACT|nr:polyprenyl synthetase family protein [Dyadobacter jiangsuensis]PSL21431.1 farnesyl-diphosphate synthase /geranylgeranyl-diphosphate synthase [Dyadobacter jiangsuensis]